MRAHARRAYTSPVEVDSDNSVKDYSSLFQKKSYTSPDEIASDSSAKDYSTFFHQRKKRKIKN